MPTTSTSSAIALLLSSLAGLAPAQVLAGDIAITGFSTDSFAIASPPNVVNYNTGGFGGMVPPGTSQSILHVPCSRNEFIIGGFGFIGRATVIGPGVVSYMTITTSVGNVAQMSWDAAGNLVVIDTGVDQVLRVTPAGVVTNMSMGMQPWGDLTAGAFDPMTGDVVLTDTESVYRLPSGSMTGTLFATIGLLEVPSGVLVDPNTNETIVTLFLSDRIVQVGAAGMLTDIVPPGTIDRPNSIDIDANGNYLIGAGSGELHSVSPAGVAMLLASAPLLGSSLSGVAFVRRGACAFGSGCPSPVGTPVLSTMSNIAAGLPLVTMSDNHNDGVIGLAVYGLGTPEPPLNLDPILGTTGCSLLANPDVIDAALTNAMGELTLTLPTTPAFGQFDLFVQHATLEGATLGTFSLTNGLRVLF